MALCIITAGCTRSAEAPAPADSTQAAQSAPGNESPGTTTGNVAIEFRGEADPLTAGDNAIEVTVKQRDGSPVTDAVVTAVFSMPAMPSMNMPAMRTSTTFVHEANGRYRGNSQLAMGGTWNVAVTVSRGSEELGTRRLSVVAK